MAVTSFGTPAMTRATSGSVTGTWGTGQNRTAGHLLVAMVSAGGSTASAAAISTPSGWTQLLVESNTATTANAWVAGYYKVAAGSDSAPAFTATLSGTAAMTVTLLELAAANDLNPADTTGVYASGGSSGTLSSMTVTSAANVSASGEYAVTCYCQEAAAATNTWNGGGSWTNAASDGSTSSVLHTAVDVRVSPSAGSAAAETGHWTTNTTAFGAAVIVVFGAQSESLEVFTNDATTSITSGGGDAPAAGTAELWTAASWSGFPVASPTTTPPTAFHIADPNAASELIQVVNTSTGLVVRGAEGTTPVTHSSGFAVRQVITAGYLNTVATVIPPSGDTTGVTDVANINAALAAGIAVQLLQAPLSAPYYINAPITPISQSRLWGAQWWSASNDDYYGAGIGESGGTVIVMVPGSGFPSGSAGIQMVNTTSNQYYGVDLAGFTIEGDETSGSGVYGILIDGAWGAGFMRGVCVHRPDQDCLHVTFDSTSNIIADDWLISECKFTGSRNGYGVYANHFDDAWFTDCEASENQLDNWYLLTGDNMRLTSCKAEDSKAGAGYHLGGIYAGQVVYLTGCTTNTNYLDGYLFDNSASAGEGLYVLTGCSSSEDGAAGGTTYAGFRSDGCLAQIAATGGAVILNTSPNTPAYGASQTSSGYGMSFTGTLLTGWTAATYDDGSNTIPLINLLPAYTRSFGTGVAPGVVALADASTIAVNAALGNDFRVTLGGNRTMGAPSNPVDGQDITFLVTQDATGSRTLSWNSAYDFGATGAPTLSTAASASDLIGFKYVAAKSKWCCLGSGLGF